jgi:predicted  nucleic acid-binding Zn-ribbon protein
MTDHDVFKELCALGAAGQLSAEEHTRLAAHLGECDECRSSYRDFAELVCSRIPLAQNEWQRAWTALTTRPASGARQRFLKHAQAEGLAFSPAVEGRPAPHRPWYPATKLAAAAICVLLALIFVGYRIQQTHFRTLVQERLAALSTAHQALGTAHQLMETTQTLRQDLNEQRSEAAAKDQQLAELRLSLHQRDNQIQALGRDLEQSRLQGSQLGGAIQESQKRISDLQAQIQGKEKQVADAGAEVARLRRTADEHSADLASQLWRVRDLNEQLRVAKANLELEHQLIGADKEVRDIMGARQLHIVDVHDSDGEGNPRKAFGRVFYTEGKSLVFYAFDINESKLSKAKLVVWGAQEGKAYATRSLGLLYSDDKAKRRWTLKVKDPELLKEIDSVFVTLEPHEGVKIPSGRQMLYAYLGEANHP